MKNCDKCEYFFNRKIDGSPCAKCISGKWGDGFKRASVRTRIRILERRLKMIVER